MHDPISLLAALLLAVSSAFFAWAGYKVWKGDVVVRHRDGSVKSPLRYALLASFCAFVAAYLIWEGLAGR